MNVLFVGTTEACFAHLAQSTERDHLPARKIIADFCKVGDPTVYRWIKGTMAPVGEALMRLRFYLEFLGYDVDELRGLPDPVRDTARLFAFGIVSLSDIVSLVGYSTGSGAASQLLAVFRGVQGVSKEKIKEFVSIARTYGEQLLERQQKTERVRLPGKSALVRDIQLLEISSESLEVLQERMKPKGISDRDAVIESLAAMVGAMTPLAKLVSSDKFTPEDRARVRELAGKSGVFDLANLLYKLCGERSRELSSNQASSKEKK